MSLFSIVSYHKNMLSTLLTFLTPLRQNLCSSALVTRGKAVLAVLKPKHEYISVLTLLPPY